MEQFFITLLSIVAGGIGYMIVTFWFRPILKYKDIKYKVSEDLIFYANALDLEKDDGSFREDTLSRKESNRKNASALAAIYEVMPTWYQRILEKKNENPLKASENLIGLSNSSNWREAQPFINDIKCDLNLKIK